MKKILILLISIVCFAVVSAQTDTKVTLGANEYYYSFTVPSTHYITGYTNTAGFTYTVDINKTAPCNVVWFAELDSVKSSSGTDSINVDIKQNYKLFNEQTSWTTQKTVAADLDNAGDYVNVIADSSYIIPTGSGGAGNKNIPLTKIDFGRLHQLSVTPTSGAGVGKVNDRVKIVKVICKVYQR